MSYPINKPYKLHGHETVAGIKNTEAVVIEGGVGVTALGKIATTSTECVGPTLDGTAVGEGLPICPAGSIVPWLSGGAFSAGDPLKVGAGGAVFVATLPADVALVKATAMEAATGAAEYPSCLVK